MKNNTQRYVDIADKVLNRDLGDKQKNIIYFIECESIKASLNGRKSFTITGANKEMKKEFSILMEAEVYKHDYDIVYGANSIVIKFKGGDA